VVAYLQAAGFPEAYRSRGSEGPRDIGDVLGFARWALDCKDQAKISLGSWVGQVNNEARNLQAALGAVIVKRRGKPAEDAFVVMDLATWVKLEIYIDELTKEIRDDGTG